jgi:hypothetical protein
MRVVHINVTDAAGGAGIAARRLHQALLAEGVDSWMLVQQKDTDDPRVVGPSKTEEAFTPGPLRQRLDRMPLRLRHGLVRTAWHVGWLPNPGLAHRIRVLRPDVAVLHWIGAGMLPYSLLKSLPCPAAWVLHDMGPLTGGCHYDRGCGRFQTGCGRCPILRSDKDDDLSRSIFLEAAGDGPHARAAGGHQQLDRRAARRSLMFAGKPVRTIHHPMDLTLFRPRDRAITRSRLGWRWTNASSSLAPSTRWRTGQGLRPPAQGPRIARRPGLRAKHRAARDGFQGRARNLRRHSSILPRLARGPGRAFRRFAAADIVVTPSEQEAFGLVAAEASLWHPGARL